MVILVVRVQALCGGRIASENGVTWARTTTSAATSAPVGGAQRPKLFVVLAINRSNCLGASLVGSHTF